MKFPRFTIPVVVSVALLWHGYVFFPGVFVAPVYTPSTIVSASGEVLYESIPLQSRSDLQREDIPELFEKLLYLQEDQDFATHPGVDVGALVRNGWQVVTGQSFAGASTLTTQYLKNIWYGGSERHVLQKLREFYAALWFERFTTKDAILTGYLQTAYFGNRMYGADRASTGYFGKVLATLSPLEMAMLITTLPSPERFHPATGVARDRALRLLELAVSQGIIDADTLDRARETRVAPKVPASSLVAPHAVQEVLRSVRERFPDFDTGGYTVTTTLDMGAQRDGERIVAHHVTALASRNVTNGSLLVMNPETGAIHAMVGSVDFASTKIDGQVNMTVMKRQPGSSLKPFTYLAGLLSGWTPASILYDIPTTFPTAANGEYMPRNYDLKYHGPVSVRMSLGSSLNIPAVKMLDAVGFEAWYALMEAFGIHFPESPQHYGLGITLGGGEVRMVDLVRAYAILANGGYLVEPHLVTRIVRNGQLVWETHHRMGIRALALPHFPLAVWQITNILQDASARGISFGIASRLNIGEHVAVKTGTTKDFRDNWAFGYTPEKVVGVWVGNNDNTPMEAVSGITGAIPILYDLFARHTEWMDEQPHPRDPSLQKSVVCTLSGMLATSICPSIREEYFLPGTAPRQKDTWYREIWVEQESGKLWDVTCGGKKESQVALYLPTELMEWGRSMRISLPPVDFCDGTKIVATEMAITTPEDGATYVLQSHLPQEAQKITIKIDGLGKVDGELLLNGTSVDHVSELPYAGSFVLDPGEYTVDFLGKRVQFTVIVK